jgi:hypothetical protein
MKIRISGYYCTLYRHRIRQQCLALIVEVFVLQYVYSSYLLYYVTVVNYIANKFHTAGKTLDLEGFFSQYQYLLSGDLYFCGTILI